MHSPKPFIDLMRYPIDEPTDRREEILSQVQSDLLKDGWDQPR